MPAKPREVFTRLSQGISEGRWTELGELYAEDAVVEHPQRPPAGSRIEGREAIGDRFAALAGGSLELRARNVVIHETTDPEVIVAEYDYDGRYAKGEIEAHGEPGTRGEASGAWRRAGGPSTRTRSRVLNNTDGKSGRSFHCANIQVLRIRDGLIVHSRDYHDYFAMAAARDELDELKAQYDGSQPELDTSPTGVPTAASGTPRGVFERLVYGISDGKRGELAELYAEDAYVTHPFHPTAPPLKGREELRAHFAGALGDRVIRARNLVVYETIDPELIVAEFDYEGKSSAGRPVRTSNIFVLRVSGGEIVKSRDYVDHRAFAG